MDVKLKKVLLSWPGEQLSNICVTNNHIYVPFVVITICSFFYSSLIIGLVPRITQWTAQKEQRFLTIPQHWSRPGFFLHVLVWFVLFIFSLRFGFVLWCILRFSCKKCSVRLLMLFILIFVYWCRTRFRCQMIFVPFMINTVHPLFLVGFVLPDL